jgi:hypothetical protein
VTAGAATASIVGLLAFAAWDAAIASSEYASGSIVVIPSTVSRRLVINASELAAVASVADAGAIISATIALFGVLAVTPSGPYALGEAGGTGSSAVLVLTLVTAAGAAVGILTRSPSASIAIVVVAVPLPDTAGGHFSPVRPWVVGASPGAAISQVVGSAPLPARQTYPAGAGPQPQR